VDRQHQRILPGGVEVRRLHDPALNLPAVGAGEPHFLDRPKLLAGEDVAVHVRELLHRRWLAHVERHNVSGLVGRGEDGDGISGRRDLRDVQ
jgi:hypothetical protein